MSEEKKILNKLTERKVTPIGDIVRDSSEENKFYAFIKTQRDKKGAQSPSSYKLKQLADELDKENINLSFVLVEENNQDIQASIKAVLFRFFPEQVRDAFIAYEPDGITVWIAPKKLLTEEEEKQIHFKVQELCDFLGIKLNTLKITSSENVPSPTACLVIIRQKAPINIEKLQMELVAKGFHVPSREWLSKVLDKLRKNRRILRQKSGLYVMTLNGLRTLGSGKNRRSPDISRALDLARSGE